MSNEFPQRLRRREQFMGIPQNRAVDVTQLQQDKQVYNYWFRHEFGTDVDGDEYAQRISDAIYASIAQELTKRQRTYFWAYYMEGLTVREIAEINGVDKSTVSRGLIRAKKRVARVLKYVDQRFIYFLENGDSNQKRRNNTTGSQRFKRRI